MLVKKDVLVLNGQKLVQGMQVHKQLMLQIMPQRIAAHHLLRLFVQLAIDKDQWLIKIERISVYQNGYVIYRAHKRVTVFSLRNCVHYKYDALEGAGHHIEEEEFDEYEWHIRLVLEGEDRIFMNYEIIQGKWMPSREDREYREEILEGVDEAVSTLERMISEERVEELLSTLTDLQRKVVHTHLFHGLSFTEAAKHLGMTRQNLTGIYNAAIYKIQKKHFRALCS